MKLLELFISFALTSAVLSGSSYARVSSLWNAPINLFRSDSTEVAKVLYELHWAFCISPGTTVVFGDEFLAANLLPQYSFFRVSGCTARSLAANSTNQLLSVWYSEGIPQPFLGLMYCSQNKFCVSAITR